MYADDEWFIGTYARSAMILGRFDEAVTALQHQLPDYEDNRHWSAIQLSTGLHLLGRYDEELTVIRGILDLAETNVVRPDIIRRLRVHELRALAALRRTDEMVARAGAEADRLELRDWQLAAAFVQAGKYLLIHDQDSVGLSYYRRALQLMETLEPSERSRYRHHEMLTDILAVLGDWERMRLQANAWLADYPDSWVALTSIGLAAANLGDVEAADHVIARLERDANDTPPTGLLVAIATLYAELDRRIEAGRWLVAAFTAGHPRTGVHELEWSIGPLTQFSALRGIVF